MSATNQPGGTASTGQKDQQQQQQQKEVSFCWNQRSLPREIIKWIQGLDLSYSVRDPRRDLSNGFLIAEIYSRYYPGKVQMHSFDNSHNITRRKNNWELLQLFFKKNEIPFEQADWEKILKDYDTEQLINFMAKSYQFLTQRKISRPPLANFVNSRDFLASTNLENQTTSFLLKDKGLEKLEDKKEEKLNEEKDNKKLDGSLVSENKAQITNMSSKRTNFLRVPSKPISQNIESLNFQIDVKETKVRPITGSILKLRETKMLGNEPQDQFSQMQGFEKFNSIQQSKRNIQGNNNVLGQEINKSTTGQVIGEGALINSVENLKSVKKDKVLSIIDYLNNMLTDAFQRPENQLELKKLKVKKVSITNLTQQFSDNIDIFNEEFIINFFSDIQQSMDAFISFLAKDPNDVWKFFNFFFTCINNLSAEKESLKQLVELMKLFGHKSLQRDTNKTKNIFLEFFLQHLAEQIKSCLLFEKKELLIQIAYAFTPNDPVSRHQMICALKEALKCHSVFMQTLVVLIGYEEQITDGNKMLFEDFLHYANQNLFSSSTNMRTMSLALFSHIAELKYELVMKSIFNRIDQLAKNEWWENKCLVIILFSKIIKGIIASERYQNLVKNPSANQKFFSVENERMVTEMKEQIDKFAKGIKTASFPPSSDMILSTTFIYIVELLGESKTLLELFLNLILMCNQETRYWVLHNDDQQQQQQLQQQPQNQQEQGLGEAVRIVNQEPSQNGEDQQQLNGEEDNNNNIDLRQQSKEQSKHKKEQAQMVYIIHSDKSLKYKTQINSQAIRQYASDVLLTLVEMIKNMPLDKLSYEYMDLIVYGFNNTDFKVINMESCEAIANTLKEYIFLSLCDEDLCDDAKNVLNKLLDLQFKADVKIKDSDSLFSSAICLIYKNKFQKCINNVEEILQQLVEQGIGLGIENIKQYIDEVYTGIKQRNGDQYLETTNLGKILAGLKESQVKQIESKSNMLSPQQQPISQSQSQQIQQTSSNNYQSQIQQQQDKSQISQQQQKAPQGAGIGAGVDNLKLSGVQQQPQQVQQKPVQNQKSFQQLQESEIREKDDISEIHPQQNSFDNELLQEEEEEE